MGSKWERQRKDWCRPVRMNQYNRFLPPSPRHWRRRVSQMCGTKKQHVFISLIRNIVSRRKQWRRWQLVLVGWRGISQAVKANDSMQLDELLSNRRVKTHLKE